MDIFDASARREDSSLGLAGAAGQSSSEPYLQRAGESRGGEPECGGDEHRSAEVESARNSKYFRRRAARHGIACGFVRNSGGRFVGMVSGVPRGCSGGRRGGAIFYRSVETARLAAGTGGRRIFKPRGRDQIAAAGGADSNRSSRGRGRAIKTGDRACAYLFSWEGQQPRGVSESCGAGIQTERRRRNTKWSGYRLHARFRNACGRGEHSWAPREHGELVEGNRSVWTADQSRLGIDGCSERGAAMGMEGATAAGAVEWASGFRKGTVGSGGTEPSAEV